MTMTWVWVLMVCLSVGFGWWQGTMDAVTAAAFSGAASAVELCLTMAGPLLLWCGVIEVLHRSGLSGKLSRLLRPLLRRILPDACRDEETLQALCGNVSANLLGLGNAATPLGIRAASRMALRCDGTASDELCRLVVLNTASVQLLPTTVAAVRSACGCQTPLDILPAVWLSSAFSVSVGLGVAFLLGKLWHR